MKTNRHPYSRCKTVCLAFITKKRLLFLFGIFISFIAYGFINSNIVNNSNVIKKTLSSLSLMSPNNVPTDIKLDGGDTDYINENRLVGSLVSILTSDDNDPGDTLIFTLVAGSGDADNGSFYIERRNKLMLNTVPDFETKNSYSIRLRVDDSNGGIYEEAFVIHVVDIAVEQTDISQGIQVWDYNDQNDYVIPDPDKVKVDKGVAQLISVSEFQVNDAVNNWQMHSRSALMNNGKIIIVWQSNDDNHTTNASGQTNDNSGSHIAAKIIDQYGKVVKPEFQVNDEIESWQDYPDVTILQNGQIFISWYTKDLNHNTNAPGQTNDNDEEHIAAKIYNQDGTVAVPEFQVNDEIELREYFPNASVLSNGQIFITWASGDTLHFTNAPGQANDNNIRHIAAKILNTDGTTAIGEFQINDEVENIQTHPRAILLDNGKIFITWASKDENQSTNAPGQTNDNDHYHIAAKIVNPDGTFAVSEFQVNDEVESIQDLPIPAVLKNGQIMLVWESKDSNHSTNLPGQDNDDDGFHIAAKIINPDGSVVKPEFQVNDKIFSDQKGPRLAVLGDGRIFITWQSKDYTDDISPFLFPMDDDNYHISAKIVNPDGTTSVDEFQVNYEIERWQKEPDILELSNGDVMITWFSQDNYHSTSILGQTYDDSVNHIAGLILNKEGIAAEYPASYATTSPNISLNTSLVFNTKINSFSAIISNNNEGSVKYQVSKDGGITWEYHNGTSWQTTTAEDGTNTNTAAEIDANIATLADDGGSFNCRAFLKSNGSQKVELDQINVAYVLSYNVTGTVWYDENGNGIKDATENAGLQNVEVKLIDDSNSNGHYDAGETVVKQTTSMANGMYQFQKVFNGNYVIVVDYLDSALNNDPVNNSLTYGLTTPGEIAITVSGVDVDDNDFGFDDAKVTLSIDQESIPENGGVAIVQVSVQPATGFTTTVTLATSGVAMDGIDYVDQSDNGQLNNKSIIIPAGSMNGTRSILAVDDAILEISESVIVDINTVTNATEDGVQRDSTKILDDDANPGIEATKTSVITDNYPDGIGAGDLITYTITVENIGNVELFDVGLTDQLEDFNHTGLTLDSGPDYVSSDGGSAEGHLFVGEIATYTATYTITQSDVDANGVSNSATASGHDEHNSWVYDVSDDGDDLDGNTEDDPTENPLMKVVFDDLCDCDDPLNFRGNNSYYFHKHVIVTGDEGLSVSIDFNVAQYLYDNNGNLLSGLIIMNETSPGVYESDFWAKYSQPFIFAVMADNDATAQKNGECTEVCNTTFAKNDVNITPKNTPVSGNVLINDTDSEGDNQTVNTTPVFAPSHGSVVLHSDGTYTYTPNNGFVGIDIFRYEICDDAPISVCDMADVYITVFEYESPQNNPPVGVQDFNLTTINVAAYGNVLVNDSDPDHDNIAADPAVVIGTRHGSLTLHSNGNYQYQPDFNFVGLDTFYYRLCDDGTPVLCDITLAIIEVVKPKVSNVTYANDDVLILEKNETGNGNVSDNDFDPEGDNTFVNTTPISGPTHGTVVLNQDGSFVYMPALDYIGNDQFVYEVCDDGNPTACNKATVYISILEKPVLGVIGDFVWHDIDGDGIQDYNEPGIPGAKVKLYSVTRELIKTEITNSQGKYRFEEVDPGEYYIIFDLPDGYTDATDDNVGPDDEIDSDIDNTTDYLSTNYFTVENNDTILSIDGGFYKCVTIGDLVWLDTHENNVYDDDETGIDGLRVELYRLYKGSWTLWDIEYTGISPFSICGDGYYSFCTNPGRYYLKFILPPQGLVPAQPFVGNDPNRDSDVTNANGYGTTDVITVYSGTSGNKSIDAGYYGMSTIENSRVWIDNNANGIRENNESGLPNMKVELYDIYGDLYSSTYTDENGEYNLTYLQAENYYLKFKIPDNYSSYTFTKKNQGDDTHDSDVTGDYGYGTTQLFGLQPKETKEYQDAGLAKGVLPLNYIAIGAKWQEDNILVYWTTANEVNVNKFIVQRAFENTNSFKDIDEIKASGKRSNSYRYLDKDDFENGVYYYRIVEIDEDGNKIISNTVAVFVDKSQDNKSITVYPNPSTIETNINFYLEKQTDVKIDILDMNAIVKIRNIANGIYRPGIYNINVDTRDLSPATYFVRIKSNNNIRFKKLIILGK